MSIEEKVKNRNFAPEAKSTFILSILFGPPIGAIFYFIFVVAIIVIFGNDPDAVGYLGDNASNKLLSNLGLLPILFLLFVVGSYFYGGIPAAIGGAILAVFVFHKGKLPIWVPLLIAVAPAILFFPLALLIYTGRVPVSSDDKIVLLQFSLSIIAFLLFSSLGTWLVIQRKVFSNRK